MKQIRIETSKNTILAVPVPDGAMLQMILNFQEPNRLIYKIGKRNEFVILLDGNWVYGGIVCNGFSSLTDKQWAGVVDWNPLMSFGDSICSQVGKPIKIIRSSKTYEEAGVRLLELNNVPTEGTVFILFKKQ